MFRVPVTTLTNDFYSVANLKSPFLLLEDIILQNSELTSGIDKGQFLRSRNFSCIFFEVVWEIWKGKLLQIISGIFSCKRGPISHWLSFFKTCLFSFFSWSLLSPCRFLPVLVVTLTGDWSSLLGIGIIPLLGIYTVPLLGMCFLSLGCWLLCLLSDWQEFYTPFLLFVVRKCCFFAMKMAIFFIWWRFI